MFSSAEVSNHYPPWAPEKGPSFGLSFRGRFLLVSGKGKTITPSSERIDGSSHSQVRWIGKNQDIHGSCTHRSFPGVPIPSLKLTASSPLKIGIASQNGNNHIPTINHPFSGAMNVSFRECSWLLPFLAQRITTTATVTHHIQPWMLPRDQSLTWLNRRYRFFFVFFYF